MLEAGGIPGAAAVAGPETGRGGAATGLLPGASICGEPGRVAAAGASVRGRAELIGVGLDGVELAGAALVVLMPAGSDAFGRAGCGDGATAGEGADDAARGAVGAAAGPPLGDGRAVNSLIRSTVAESRLAKLLALTSRPQF